MTKMKRDWSGKKEPTNPKKKEQHAERKTKLVLLHELQEKDWQEQVKEYGLYRMDKS